MLSIVYLLKQEHQRAEEGRRTLAVELQKANAKSEILANDLETSRAHVSD